NSASAQLFPIEETAISAGAFIRGLKTNLTHLPDNVTASYQRHRFVGTSITTTSPTSNSSVARWTTALNVTGSPPDRARQHRGFSSGGNPYLRGSKDALFARRHGLRI